MDSLYGFLKIALLIYGAYSVFSYGGFKSEVQHPWIQ